MAMPIAKMSKAQMMRLRDSAMKLTKLQEACIDYRLKLIADEEARAEFERGLSRVYARLGMVE
jgi:hypothetical protein